MPISINCPHCQYEINAPEHLVGKRVKCPQCKQGITIPQIASEEPAYDAPYADAPVHSAPPKKQALPVATLPPQQNSTKLCVECKADIHIDATKCRYCASVQPPPPPPPTSKWKPVIIVVFVLAAVISCAIMCKMNRPITKLSPEKDGAKIDEKKSIEHKLAILEAGYNVPEDDFRVRTFRILLEDLDTLCIENKQQIAKERRGRYVRRFI